MTETNPVRATFQLLDPPLAHRWRMRVDVVSPHMIARAAAFAAEVGGVKLEGLMHKPEGNGFIGYLRQPPAMGAALVFKDGALRLPTGITFRPPSGPPAGARSLDDDDGDGDASGDPVEEASRSAAWALDVACSVNGSAASCGGCTATERRIRGGPQTLVNVSTNYVTSGAGNTQLDDAAAQAFMRMRDAAVADNVITADGPYLRLVSGYRSYASQKTIWLGKLRQMFESFGCTNWAALQTVVERTNAALETVAPPHGASDWLARFRGELSSASVSPQGCTDERMHAAHRAELGTDASGALEPVALAVRLGRQTVAPPGVSPHHTGRALDLNLGHHPRARSTTHSSSTNVAWQREQPWYRWLVCNAGRFGFAPYNREPWHWEFEAPAATARGMAADDVTREDWRVHGVDVDDARATDLDDDVPAASAFLPLWMIAYVNLKDRASLRPQDATHEHAVALVSAACAFLEIPWRAAWTLLEHEGGVAIARRDHHDGIMQTTAAARRGTVNSIPHTLLLAALGKMITDRTTLADLRAEALRVFGDRLAVQVAFGCTELATMIKRFGGCIALGYAAYNTGAGNVERMMGTTTPANLADATWLTTCSEWAAKIHAGNVTIGNGWWQCDGNMPGWFAAARVEDTATGRWLAGYKYLRSFRFQIHRDRPTLPCSLTANHRNREPGTGPMENRRSRNGVLDKLYDPTLLARAYVDAVSGGLAAITDNRRVLRARGGVIVEVDDHGVETELP